MESTLRAKLKEHKVKYKLSDYQIALDAGVAQSVIQRFLLGRGKFLPKTYSKITKYLTEYLSPEERADVYRADIGTLIERKDQLETAIKRILAEAKQVLSSDYIFSRAVSNIKHICTEALK